MKRLLGLSILLSVFAFTSNALAGREDARILKGLLKGGAEINLYSASITATVQYVTCTKNKSNHACVMNDIYANDSAGESLVMDGDSAEFLYELLLKNKAPAGDVYGKNLLSAYQVGCKQSAEGDVRSSKASRTKCEVQLSQK